MYKTLSPQQTVGKYRWRIVAMLFAATTINYLDRQVVGLLKPTLEQEFGWTELDYSHMVMIFQAAYTVSLLFFGGLVDRIGSRREFDFDDRGFAVDVLKRRRVPVTLEVDQHVVIDVVPLDDEIAEHALRALERAVAAEIAREFKVDRLRTVNKTRT